MKRLCLVVVILVVVSAARVHKGNNIPKKATYGILKDWHTMGR